jgi:hypothetical protein
MRLQARNPAHPCRARERLQALPGSTAPSMLGETPSHPLRPPAVLRTLRDLFKLFVSGQS